MTFTVVSNWDEAYEPVAAAAYPAVRAYAAARGYGHRRYAHPGHYGKVQALLDAFDSADWLFWLDADATVTNPLVELPFLVRAGADFVVTCDRLGLNTGAVLVRTSPAAYRLLSHLADVRAEFDHPPYHDQTGFAHALWRVKDRVDVLPQRTMNSYPEHPLVEPAAVWQPGDFVLHCAGLPPAEKIALLARHQESP